MRKLLTGSDLHELHLAVLPLLVNRGYEERNLVRLPGFTARCKLEGFCVFGNMKPLSPCKLIDVSQLHLNRGKLLTTFIRKKWDKEKERSHSWKAVENKYEVKVSGAAGGTEQSKQPGERHVDRSCWPWGPSLGALSAPEAFERIWEDMHIALSPHFSRQG